MSGMAEQGISGRADADRSACPVCGRAGAVVPGGTAPCERCGADLTAYRDAIAKAQRLLQTAQVRLPHDPPTALRLAERAARLHATPEAHRIQALAALCARQYPTALACYRAWRSSR